jgi:hypothetical protein
MMGATTNFAIRYPDGTDQICDTATFIQNMAEDIDAIMDDLDSDINGLINVPYARVSGYDILDDTGSLIGYTSVDADYANLFNLSIDPTSAYPPPGSYWRVGQRVAFNTINTGNAFAVSVHNDVGGTGFVPGTVVSTGYDPGGAITVGTAVMQSYGVTSSFLTAITSVSGASLDQSGSQGATFFVYWMADQ